MKNKTKKSTVALLAWAGVALIHGLALADEKSTSSPTDLLEEGIYLQEAKGDLEGAIARYREVVELAQGNRALVAEALYRLGVSHLEEGNTIEAARAFDVLSQNYTDQDKWLEAALAHLPQPFQSTSTPWRDGERTKFELRLPNGKVIGRLVYGTSLDVVDGESLWRFTHRTLVRNGVSQFISVWAKPHSFAPVKGSFFNSQIGSGDYKFSDGEAEIQFAKTETASRIPLEASVYDNEQAVHFMRQFPVKAGFKTERSLFVPFSGAVVPVGFEITNVETMDTFMGPVECYQVDISIMGQTQAFWYTSDERRRMVKFRVGTIEATAIGSQISSPGQSVGKRFEQVGLSLEIPSEWQYFEDKKQLEDAKRIRIGTLDALSHTQSSLDASVSETIDESIADADSARKIGEEQLERLAKSTKGFELRKDTWAEYAQRGASVVYFAGDTEYPTGPRVSAKAILVSGKRHAIATLNCLPEDETDAFALFKTMVDSISIDPEKES